jgi:hypothetical protein
LPHQPPSLHGRRQPPQDCAPPFRRLPSHLCCSAPCGVCGDCRRPHPGRRGLDAGADHAGAPHRFGLRGGQGPARRRHPAVACAGFPGERVSSGGSNSQARRTCCSPGFTSQRLPSGCPDSEARRAGASSGVPGERVSRGGTNSQARCRRHPPGGGSCGQPCHSFGNPCGPGRHSRQALHGCPLHGGPAHCGPPRGSAAAGGRGATGGNTPGQ